MPFTLHETAVLFVPVTVAWKLCGSPRSTEAAVGITLMLMEEGLGAEGVATTEPAIPPPQPPAQPPATIKLIISVTDGNCDVAQEATTAFEERARTHRRNAGEWPAVQRAEL